VRLWEFIKRNAWLPIVLGVVIYMLLLAVIKPPQGWPGQLVEETNTFLRRIVEQNDKIISLLEAIKKQGH
jgi:hypothetical protein